VLEVLDSAGKPHQALGDPELRAYLRRNRSVGHRRRMADERLHSAQGLGEGEDPHVLKQMGGPFPSTQLDADHSPEPAHLSPRQLVLRMTGESGVEDLVRT